MEELILRCTALNSNVVLTQERLKHIEQGHPEVAPEHIDKIVETIQDPGLVRVSRRQTGGLLLSRWYPEILNGKHLVVVVISTEKRSWVATAYFTRQIRDQ